MLVTDVSGVIDKLRGFPGKEFLLKLSRPRGVLEARKKFRPYPRSKMSKQVRRANARELFAQARRLTIKLGKLGTLAPAFVQHAQTTRCFERRHSRADLAAQHSLSRRDEFQVVTVPLAVASELNTYLARKTLRRQDRIVNLNPCPARYRERHCVVARALPASKRFVYELARP